MESLSSKIKIKELKAYTSYFKNEETFQKLEKLFRENTEKFKELETLLKEQILPVVIVESLLLFLEESNTGITFSSFIELLKRAKDEEEQMSIIKNNVEDFDNFIVFMKKRVMNEINSFLSALEQIES